MKMEIDVAADRSLLIKKVYSGAYIETSEGNRIGFCLRDDTVEFNVLPNDGTYRSQWYRVNMQTLEVEKMGNEDATPVRGAGEVHNAG